MNKTIKELLIQQGFNPDDYTYIDKTCDNVKLKHNKSGKVVDFRW